MPQAKISADDDLATRLRAAIPALRLLQRGQLLQLAVSDGSADLKFGMTQGAQESLVVLVERPGGGRFNMFCHNVAITSSDDPESCFPKDVYSLNDCLYSAVRLGLSKMQDDVLSAIRDAVDPDGERFFVNTVSDSLSMKSRIDHAIATGNFESQFCTGGDEDVHFFRVDLVPTQGAAGMRYNSPLLGQWVGEGAPKGGFVVRGSTVSSVVRALANEFHAAREQPAQKARAPRPA